MHLALDFSESEFQPTGVGTFASNLVDQWLPEIGTQGLTLTLMMRDSAGVPERWQETGVRVLAGGAPRAHPILWQQLTLPGMVRRVRPDVFFGPAYSLPHFHRTPSAVALHDLSFERFPGAWSWRESWRRRILARSAARRALRIVTISEFSAAELRALYRVPREKIRVVPLGVRSDLSSSSEAARANLLQRLGLREDCPVVLHVGTVLGRRHVPELIQATALLDRPCQLVVVGQNKTRPATPLDQLAQQAGMTNRFVHLPYIETEELSALYSLADVYVSLSDYEGFGLPVLEAAACSTPALVLDSGASRELWADHAHFVASSDPISVARAIQQVLDQPELGRRDRPGVLARHTWKACAAQVLAALQEIAR